MYVCAFVVLGFVCSVLCQEIGWDERFRSDLFCVKWVVKPSLSQSIMKVQVKCLGMTTYSSDIPFIRSHLLNYDQDEGQYIILLVGILDRHLTTQNFTAVTAYDQLIN